MINIKEKYKEIIMYIFMGGMTTIINIISFMVICSVLKVDWTISNIISWIISVIFAYIVNKNLVFKAKSNNLL